MIADHFGFAAEPPGCGGVLGPDQVARRYSSYERWEVGRRLFEGRYRHLVIAALEIAAKLGHFNQDAATTMAAVLVAVVLMAYWILKT